VLLQEICLVIMAVAVARAVRVSFSANLLRKDKRTEESITRGSNRDKIYVHEEKCGSCSISFYLVHPLSVTADTRYSLLLNASSMESWYGNHIAGCGRVENTWSISIVYQIVSARSISSTV